MQETRSDPRILLEVIVSTLADAREAVRGGADRLEVVRNIELGELTPPLDLVRAITGGTSVPLRVMVRENAGFDTNRGELNAMRRAASAFADIGVDGLVIGFARDGQPLVGQVGEIIDAAPGTRVTYNRAFDTLTDQVYAIEQLSAIRQIDRILTDGGDGSPAERCERLRRLSAAEGKRLSAFGPDLFDQWGELLGIAPSDAGDEALSRKSPRGTRSSFSRAAKTP